MVGDSFADAFVEMGDVSIFSEVDWRLYGGLFRGDSAGD